MTPTPEQLAAVLPRCSAGLDGGDWTDDDERLAWARRVLRYVEEASRRQGWFLGGPRGGLHISSMEALRDYPGDRIHHPGAGHYDRQRDGSWLWCPDSAPESPQTDAQVEEATKARAVCGHRPDDSILTASGDPVHCQRVDGHDGDHQCDDFGVQFVWSTPPSRESRTFDDLEGARRAFFAWSASHVPVPLERGSTGHTEANPGKSDRDTHGPKHGDRWVTRNDRATIVASNDWPAPTGPDFHTVLTHATTDQRKLEAAVAEGITYYRQGFGK